MRSSSLWPVAWGLIGLGGCEDQPDVQPTRIEVSVPLGARALWVAFSDGETVAVEVSPQQSFGSLDREGDPEDADLAFFDVSLPTLGLASGPVTLPLLSDDGTWTPPDPIARFQLREAELSPTDELPFLAERGLAPRRQCLRRTGDRGIRLTSLGPARALLAATEGRMIVLDGSGGSALVDRAGRVSPWSAGTDLGAQDFFIDGAGQQWVATDRGAVFRFPRRIDPSTPLPNPWGQAPFAVLKLDGPSRGPATTIAAVLSDRSVVTMSPEVTQLAEVPGMDPRGGFQDVAWLPTGNLVAYDNSGELDLFEAGGGRSVETLPFSLQTGIRLFGRDPRGRLFAATRSGELFTRGSDGEWAEIEGASSLAGVRDLRALDDGVAWIDDVGVVFTYGPETGICAPSVAFGNTPREGDLLRADGVSLFIASQLPNGGVLAGWADPEAAPR